MAVGLRPQFLTTKTLLGLFRSWKLISPSSADSRERGRSYIFYTYFLKWHIICNIIYTLTFLSLVKFYKFRTQTPTRLFPTSDTSCNLGSSQAICTSDHLAPNLWAFNYPPRYNTSLEWLMELRTELTFTLLFDHKEFKSEPTKEMQKARSQRVSNTRLPYLQHTYTGSTLAINIQGAHPASLVSRFLLRFCSVGLVDWIIDHRIKFNFSLSFLPRRSDWCHVIQSPNPLVTWLVFLAQPTSMVKLSRGLS